MRPRTRAAGVIACAAIAALGVTAAAGSPGEPGRPGGPLAADSNIGIGEPQTDRGAQNPLPADPAEKIGTVPVVAKRGPAPTPSSALRELRSAPKPPAVRLDSAGRIRTVTAPAGHELKPPGTPAGAESAVVADTFVRRYAPAFGVSSATTMTKVGTITLPGGDTVIRYNQYAASLPVLGGQVVVTVNRRGVVGATAEATPAAPVAIAASVPAPAAAQTAIATAAARYQLAAGTLHTDRPKLWLYDPRLVDGPGPAELRPTWQVTVHDTPGSAGHGRGDVYVDGLTGQVTMVIDGHREVRDRLVCDLKNAAVDLNVRERYRCDGFTGSVAVARREGGAASSIADVNTVYDNLGKAYDFFKNKVGRDSFDGRGGQIRATVRACYRAADGSACPYRNAFWEGTQFVFGTGLTVDDITAHEFTHGVTEHTSNLIYWRQSGAINEALSDIFGQFVDLQTPADDAGAAHWQIGEDSVVGPIRDMANPTLFRQPDRYSSDYWDLDPDGYRDNGGVHTNSGVANKAAYLIVSGGTFNGQTIASIGTNELNAIDKSALLWYRVQNLLPSGADYRDLGATLSSACRALVGYAGFTATNCTQVDKAVTATEMDMAPETGGHGAAEAPECASPGQPTRSLYYDGMERAGTGWLRSNTGVWAYSPSAQVPFTYAAAGKGSLNGYAYPGNGANGTTAEMREPVTLPAGTSYLRFAHSLDSNGPAGGIQVQVNTGGGWSNLTAPSTGIPQSGGLIATPITTQGFGSTRFDLTAYAGQDVRFRFQVKAASGQYLDWYVDEFSIYQCQTAVGEPRTVNARLTSDKTGATVTWDAPRYAGPGVARYEVLVTPAPAGSTDGAYTTTAPSLTLTGLDPAVGYLLSVRAVGTDGVAGVGVSAEPLSGEPPIGCTTACRPPAGDPPRPLPPVPPVK
ncbi:M4 family metallopeptidase [Rhizomonospora bruguierae]|uniref:M4 family metallopeptidase n=1 Tax=Rhizomonospora bruguierae TaxID=1581705 RepID=UPI001BCA7568|nr:M4 family metallopeptidase [Micromonospora sp. NBRC 107566]